MVIAIILAMLHSPYIQGQAHMNLPSTVRHLIHLPLHILHLQFHYMKDTVIYYDNMYSYMYNNELYVINQA